MKIGIVAAGGNSARTGLGTYTSKAALSLRGKSLLAHQVDFLRRSGVEAVYVIARPEHARVLGRALSPEERRAVSFVLSDCATGWAGEVERAAAFVRPEDEVILVSCDNDHSRVTAFPLENQPGYFTYTTWTRTDRPPTDGPVLAHVKTAWGSPESEKWVECASAGFTGPFFSGYAVVRGSALLDAIRVLPFVDGKKEFTALLASLQWWDGFETLPYGASYEDVRDLRALALLHARKSSQDDDVIVDVGAGVLIVDSVSRRVLLTEREDGRGWVMPGGLVDPGEGYAEAARRETLEEIGIPVKDLRLLSVIPGEGKRGPACSVIFSAETPVSPVDAIDIAQEHAPRIEVTDVRWFDEAQVREIEIPFGLRDAVDDWFAGRELDAR